MSNYKMNTAIYVRTKADPLGNRHRGWLIQRVDAGLKMVDTNVGFLYQGTENKDKILRFFPGAVVMYEMEVTTEQFDDLMAHAIEESTFAHPQEHEWPLKDQCQIMSDSFFGTKCTFLASWIITYPDADNDGLRACKAHLDLALSTMIESTSDGKVITEHYTS